MELLTPEIEHYFNRSGWFPGRRIDVPPDIPSAHPAYAILQEFGALSVGTVGPGIECGASDIVFRGDNPVEISHDALILSWQTLLNTPLVCIAEVHHAHGLLWVDGQSRLFTSGAIAPLVTYAGSSFAHAVADILTGVRSRPMLLPSQERVCAWGETFEATNPRVVTPAFFKQ
ncbi:SUKH-3 domain-containing protein [Sphingomonas sp.]|uniref:SUKH-3 domain-containing protein n=1 Tax=Sphingomonas sp. TaxID=28214 RepID=UPI003F700972